MNTESATLRLGQDQTRAFIAGIAGTAGSGSAVLIDPNGQLGTIPSARRYKRAIRDIGARSQGLYQLRPVTFRYQRDARGVQQYGLIAEEVAKVYPELVVRGAKGEVETVQYHEMIAMLLTELQQRQRVLNVQAQQVAELKAQQECLRAGYAQEVAELQARQARLQAAVVRQQERREAQRAQNAAVAARLEQLEAGAAPTATVATR